jgi:membrane-associated phospholipid phosphatase
VNGDYRNTWFKTGANPLKFAGSFPSGHTGWAFAVSTVIARRCPQHKWVRVVAYGLAFADLASRITSSNHFFGDAVFGGVLGYATGRFVVLRQ